MTLPILALGALIAIIVAFTIAAIITAITTMRSEWAERNIHFHNMTWPFRIVETMDGKYRVQQYVQRKTGFEWSEANHFSELEDAKRYWLDCMAIVMKNRYLKMTNEEKERIAAYNKSVKQVVPLGNIAEQVCSYMKRSETLPEIDPGELECITSKEFVITHGVK